MTRLICGIASALLASGLCAAQAAPGRSIGAIGYVTAESDHGHGKVSGSVRRGAKNYEVRMPGGTWIDCGRDCGDTLRRETVDFWESRNGRNATDGVGGYFRWSW